MERVNINVLDQYQHLDNCPPTPPLTQQQSIDNKFRLMLVRGGVGGQLPRYWYWSNIPIYLVCGLAIWFTFCFIVDLYHYMRPVLGQNSVVLSLDQRKLLGIQPKGTEWKRFVRLWRLMLFALMTLMEVVRRSLLPVFTILSSYPWDILL